MFNVMRSDLLFQNDSCLIPYRYRVSGCRSTYYLKNLLIIADINAISNTS